MQFAREASQYVYYAARRLQYAVLIFVFILLLFLSNMRSNAFTVSSLSSSMAKCVVRNFFFFNKNEWNFKVNVVQYSLLYCHDHLSIKAIQRSEKIKVFKFFKNVSRLFLIQLIKS